MDMNSFVWVSRRTLLGGAHYSAVATLPVAKNQLVSDIHGQLSGGGGFADSYYLPLILGWNRERASIRALVGVPRPDRALRRGRQRQRRIGVLDADAVVGSDRAAHPQQRP